VMPTVPSSKNRARKVRLSFRLKRQKTNKGEATPMKGQGKTGESKLFDQSA